VLDGLGASFNDENGHGRGGNRRPVRKERDDKVHDSIIEERIQRERPCRTLFIRNIKASCHFEILATSASSVHITFRRKLIGPQYETNSDDVRHQFEEHGEIKTFFDLISTRGMVFVTYVSPRSNR
jgi:RNA recognition motif-containing protein